MPEASTSFVGPLGSTIYHLRADAETVAALAGLDWTSRFRRVWLDPVGGIVVLMSPSSLHEGLTKVFDDIVDAAASALGRATAKLGSVRLRGEGEPRGAGMEPDCSFYVGERARAYIGAMAESQEAADAFLAENGPDLIVEVEITHADAGKIRRYADLGEREIWRLRAKRGEKTSTPPPPPPSPPAPRQARGEDPSGGLPGPSPGSAAAPAGGVGGIAGAHSVGCLPGRRRRPTEPRPSRTHGGGGPHRPAALSHQWNRRDRPARRAFPL